MYRSEWLKAQADKVRDIRGLLVEYCNMRDDGREREILEKVCADLDVAAHEIDVANEVGGPKRAKYL